MPLINGIKMACEPCIRGHRATTCDHASERLMVPVRKPGRPLTSCPHRPGGRCACRVTVAIPRKRKCDCSAGPVRAANGTTTAGIANTTSLGNGTALGAPQSADAAAAASDDLRTALDGRTKARKLAPTPAPAPPTPPSEPNPPVRSCCSGRVPPGGAASPAVAKDDHGSNGVTLTNVSHSQPPPQSILTNGDNHHNLSQRPRLQHSVTGNGFGTNGVHNHAGNVVDSKQELDTPHDTAVRRWSLPQTPVSLPNGGPVTNGSTAASSPLSFIGGAPRSTSISTAQQAYPGVFTNGHHAPPTPSVHDGRNGNGSTTTTTNGTASTFLPTAGTTSYSPSSFGHHDAAAGTLGSAPTMVLPQHPPHQSAIPAAPAAVQHYCAGCATKLPVMAPPPQPQLHHQPPTVLAYPQPYGTLMQPMNPMQIQQSIGESGVVYVIYPNIGKQAQQAQGGQHQGQESQQQQAIPPPPIQTSIQQHPQHQQQASAGGGTTALAPAPQPTPVLQPPSPQRRCTVFECVCGPGCQCIGCIAHPYNSATQEYVRSAFQHILDGTGELDFTGTEFDDDATAGLGVYDEQHQLDASCGFGLGQGGGGGGSGGGGGGGDGSGNGTSPGALASPGQQGFEVDGVGMGMSADDFFFVNY